jgi:hypothetical protein
VLRELRRENGSVGDAAFVVSLTTETGRIVETLMELREGLRERIGGVKAVLCSGGAFDGCMDDRNGAGSARIWILIGRFSVLYCACWSR